MTDINRKIQLVLNLFRGRSDVYALKWQSKKGQKGFSPACRNKNKSICNKKCKKCTNPDYLPLDSSVISAHLTGEIIIGIYPLLPNNTSWFVAVDFDGKSGNPLKEAQSLLEVCMAQDIQTYLERSQSGKGYHVWIFFVSPITATKSRMVVFALLQKAQILYNNENLESFDRIFPNQDELTGKKFGNLIALPLQGPDKVAAGKSVFLDHKSSLLHPYPDQFAFLQHIKKVTEKQFDTIIAEWNLKLKEENIGQKPKTPVAIGVQQGIDILYKCDFIRYCKESPGAVTEPQWFDLATILAPFKGGRKRFHKLSRPYPGYSKSETDTKFDNAIDSVSQGMAPHTCIAIRKNGFNCSKNCSVKSPSALPALKKTEKSNLASVPYFYKDGFLYRYKSTNEGTVPLPISNFKAWVTKDIIHDDGLEQNRYFEITGICENAPLNPIEIPSNKLSGMAWVNENWGIKVTILPPTTNKDYLRHAIQVFSENVTNQRVFTHTGWRNINGKWFFMTGSGAFGNDDIIVNLPRELNKYSLPIKIDSNIKQKVLKSSLSFLEIAPLSVTIPLFIAIYMSPLTTILNPMPNFSMYLYGETGSFKTTLACLGLCHFGNFQGHEGLSNFHDTANALEKRAFILKDVPMILDDFCPAFSSKETSQRESIAQRLIRGYSNRTGRARLNADTTEKGRYEPRGMLIITGEDLPQGTSTGARFWCIEINKTQININKLSELQKKSHLLPHAMTSYIHWLRNRLDTIKEKFPKEFAELRANVPNEYTHQKVKEQIAFLYWTMDLILEWLIDEGIISEARAAQKVTEAWTVLLATAKEQSLRIQTEDPVKQFLEIFEALKTQGKTKLMDKDQPTQVVEGKEYGELIGYMDADFYYLLSTPLWHSIKAFCRSEGSYLGLRTQTLAGLLKKRGYLESDSDRNTKVERIAGKTVRVLKVRKVCFENN